MLKRSPQATISRPLNRSGEVGGMILGNLFSKEQTLPLSFSAKNAMARIPILHNMRCPISLILHQSRQLVAAALIHPQNHILSSHHWAIHMFAIPHPPAHLANPMCCIYLGHLLPYHLVMCHGMFISQIRFRIK